MRDSRRAARRRALGRASIASLMASCLLPVWGLVRALRTLSRSLLRSDETISGVGNGIMCAWFPAVTPP